MGSETDLRRCRVASIEAWVSTYLQIAAGELDVVSDTVPRITGHPAQSLRIPGRPSEGYEDLIERLLF